MLSLYTDAVLAVHPVHAAYKKEYQVPRKNGTFESAKDSHRQRNDDQLANDDQTFQSQYLASRSSIFFRHEQHYPRSFLWRVVSNSRVLQIQSIDLSRPDKPNSEADLILNFEFQDPILPLGVVFVDSANSDQLHAFVCTRRNEIYNLRLPIDTFRATSRVTASTQDLVKIIDISSLSIDTVYQLHATNPYELFVAFTGGRIQRIHRKADQESWGQDYYDDATWGATFRGIVGRRGLQQIEYGSNRLAQTTVHGMVASQDTTYLYTLCLNHTLRVWQLATGKLVDARDLLDVPREPNERLQLNPAEPGLIRLVTFPKRHSQTLITYTPHDGGQFKIWDVRGGLTGDLEIKDRFPKNKLSPPDPDPSGNTVWSLTGFEIIPGKKDGLSQMWLLWRNNNYRRVYSMHFDDILDIPDAWKDNWVVVENSGSRSAGPDIVLSDTLDLSQKWLEYLMYPGRYSPAVMETALARYQDVTGNTLHPSERAKSLRERLCTIVASSVSLRKYDTAEMDYDRFNLDTDHQWRNFWRILESMNEGRHAPLALAFDAISGMAWVVMTDGCAAVRECSRIELLQHNDADALVRSEDAVAARWPHRKIITDGQLLESMGIVLKAASKFRRSFSPDLANEFFCAIEDEIFTESEISSADRIVTIFNQVGFSDGLSEGAEQQLLRDLEPLGGVGGLNNELVQSILNTLLVHSSKRHKSTLRNTVFGTNLLIVALLEDIELARNVLLDLLVLVVFIDESDDFEPPFLFGQLISHMAEQQRNLWLSTNFRSIQIDQQPTSTTTNGNTLTKPTKIHYRLVSVMEDIFMRFVRPQAPDNRPLMYLITDLIAETQKWASGRGEVTSETATVHIQCYLLSHNEIVLASHFLKFQPSTPWSNYVKARLMLRKGYATEAFVYFRKAAYTLACGKAMGDVTDMSASLLSILDAEHFNSGLPRYWQHVMALFESEKHYVQVAEAAKYALQSLPNGQKEPILGFRSEILSRIFTSELKCARFKAAFDALIQFSDLPLQKTSLAALVNAILSPKTSGCGSLDALDTLQQLPWAMKPVLAAHLDTHMTNLAKKQLSIPGSAVYTSDTSDIDYLSVLQAYRLSKGDYRGAALALFDRYRIIQRSGRARSDPQATSIRHALLALINVMTCVAPEEAFILADAEHDPRSTSLKRPRPSADKETEERSRKRKRIVITLDDLRREYQQVLDKCSRIERGDFDFERGSDSDDEEDEEHLQTSGRQRLSHDVMEL